MDFFSHSSLVQSFLFFFPSMQKLFLAFQAGLDRIISPFLRFPYGISLGSLFLTFLTLLFLEHPFLKSVILSFLLSSIFLCALFNGINYGMKQHPIQKQLIMQLILLALILKILLLFTFFDTVIVFPDEASTYHYAGELWYGIWNGEIQITNARLLNWINNPYGKFLGIVYYVFTPLLLVGKLFNIFFSIVTAFLLYLIAKEIFNKKVALLSFTLALFMPQMVFWTIPLLRESMMLLLLSITLWSFTKLTQQFNFSFVGLSLVTLYLIFEIRHYMAVMLFTFLLLICFITLFTKGKKHIFSSLVTVLLVAILFYFLYVGVQNAFRMPGRHIQVSTYFSFEALQGARHWISLGGGTLIQENARIDTLSNALQYLPTGWSYFFFAPFLWKFYNAKLFLYAILNIIEYFLFPFFLYGMVITARKYMKKAYPLFLYVLFISAFFALAEPNLGDLIRHKIQVSLFMLIFAAKGLINCSSRFTKRTVRKARKSTP